MNKKKILSLFIATTLVSLSIFFAYRSYTLFQYNNILPSELGSEFDPTQTSPMFKVYGISDDGEKIDVSVVFPQDYLDNKVFSTKISCDDNQILIYYSEDNNVLASKTLLFETIQGNQSETVLFSGLCDTMDCKVVSRECKLFLY